MMILGIPYSTIKVFSLIVGALAALAGLVQNLRRKKVEVVLADKVCV